MKRYVAGLLALLVFLFILLQYLFHVNVTGAIAEGLSNLGMTRPELTGNINYGILAVFGLLTSIHCIGMCGPIVFAVSDGDSKREAYLKNTVFQAGRVLSYALTGLVLGGLGSLFVIGDRFRAVVPIISGVILVGLSATVILTGREVPLPPKLMNVFQRFRKGNSAFLGLLMGLMPCGSLQMVQAYALGSGSPLTGMLSMLFFALGTLPALFLFGSLFVQARRQSWKWIMPVSAVLMLILGIQMVWKGLTILGVAS